MANGRKVETKFPIKLSEFLNKQNIPVKSVVVERNKQAVSPSSFGELDLRDGDSLEIVNIVAGGGF